MVNGDQLRALREQHGWTQQQAAARLQVTQAYLSMLERGKRPTPALLQNALARLFALPATALPLPVGAEAMSESELAEALAALRYPGFGHLAAPPAARRNPAEVLAAALMRSLEARLVEALPWLGYEYSELDWNWLVREAKLHDFQNRLGYVLVVARQLAEKSSRSDAAQRLLEVERKLEHSRLAREDSFADNRLTQAECRWLRQHRSAEARHWKLLTDLTVEQVQHAF